MKTGIAADGMQRFLRGKETSTAESIEKKFAAQLSGATPYERSHIREQMAQEILRLEKIKAHHPSPATLW